MFIVGIIPARGESRTIKDKNIYPLNGKPMIEYTIEAAENSLLNDWFVFTDKYSNYKTLGIERPEKFSRGEYGSVRKWIKYAVEQYEKRVGHKVDAVMLLQPTSPLRTAEDINNAIKLFSKYNIDSLYSGYYMRIKEKIKIDGKKIEPHFQRNGAIFISNRDIIQNSKMLWSKNVFEFEMLKSHSIDIDDLDDMFIAESILKNI